MRTLLDAADEFVESQRGDRSTSRRDPATRPARVRHINIDPDLDTDLDSDSTPTSDAEFDAMRFMVATIGLDIGGTKVLGVLLGDDGTVLREERLASPHTGLDALVATGASIVDADRPSGAPVGVGAAGLVDRDGRASATRRTCRTFARRRCAIRSRTRRAARSWSTTTPASPRSAK